MLKSAYFRESHLCMSLVTHGARFYLDAKLCACYSRLRLKSYSRAHSSLVVPEGDSFEKPWTKPTFPLCRKETQGPD